ncbi:MAG: VCBS repeat-containing protein [Ignavibacteriales bacterium]|nr:MAG: VCBS repeat-containing protein [Ignavibacteriales bacterium]
MKSLKLISSAMHQIIFVVVMLFQSESSSQIFQKITDAANPIVTTLSDANYSGACWIDYDNDGDLDLHATKASLFRNNGDGTFTKVPTTFGTGIAGLGNGASWADYDHDGDLDVVVAGVPTRFYRNDGNDTFTTVIDGELGTSKDNRDWTCAWSDFNNDGYADILLVHPSGFTGNPALANRLLLSNRDGRFTRLTGYEFTTAHAPYTVATWYDFDLDGDQDLFIGSGPAGTPARDFLFRNLFTETGEIGFERINDLPMGTDLQDGQVWSLADYDNDGDLDAFITNYGGAVNRFYKNNNGTYQTITTPFTVGGNYLSNSWADFDNDGDLDLVTTSEGNIQVFFNEGSDTFVTHFTVSGAARSVALADYDEDGDIDFYNSGGGTSRGLYENINSNGNNWMQFILNGKITNPDALGAKVRLKAMVNGNPVWMMREINAQNNFNGQNSSRVHFGLGNAASIDSVVIEWTSSDVQILTNISPNQILTVNENIPSGFLRCNFSADSVSGNYPFNVSFSDHSLSDPNSAITSWKWDFDNDGTIDSDQPNPQHTYDDAGIYTVKLIVQNGSTTDTLTRDDYITVGQPTGIIETGTTVPAEYQLFQNYPNPFNPSTKIKFHLAKSGLMRLSIYDALGTKVQTIYDGYKDAGEYEVDFNSGDLTSGLYIYRLEAESYSSTKKMMVLK